MLQGKNMVSKNSVNPGVVSPEVSSGDFWMENNRFWKNVNMNIRKGNPNIWRTWHAKKKSISGPFKMERKGF